MLYDFEGDTYVEFECEAWLKSGDDPVCDYKEEIQVHAVGNINGWYYEYTCPQCGKHVPEACAPGYDW